MALMTAAQARVYVPAIQGTGNDDVIDLLIARIGAMIARYCGYPPASVGATPTLESASYVLYSEPGLVEISGDGRRLYLPVRPITAVASIYDDPNEEYGASSLVSSSDYAIDGDQGVIRLKALSTHAGFSGSPYALKIACTAGFATVPPDVVHAAGLSVQHALAQFQGVERQINATGLSLVLQALALPVEAQQILTPFRLVRGWAA